MSGDCFEIRFTILQLLPLKPSSSLSYPILKIVLRIILSRSGLDDEVISPATITSLFLTRVSHATLLSGSPAR